MPRVNPSLQKSQISEAIFEYHKRKIKNCEKFTHPPQDGNETLKYNFEYLNRLEIVLN